MEENKNLLLKGAMTYGLAMGIYWVVKYIFFIFSVSVPSFRASEMDLERYGRMLLGAREKIERFSRAAGLFSPP